MSRGVIYTVDRIEEGFAVCTGLLQAVENFKISDMPFAVSEGTTFSVDADTGEFILLPDTDETRKEKESRKKRLSGLFDRKKDNP